jgi:hypothetical protein
MAVLRLKRPRTRFNFFSDAVRPRVKEEHIDADQQVKALSAEAAVARFRRGSAACMSCMAAAVRRLINLPSK